jgi:hypothetical protein
MSVHELRRLETRKMFDGRGVATVLCSCGVWSRRTDRYVTPLVAGRIARRTHRLHARMAAEGVVTVTDGVAGPEMVIDHEDELSFLREAVQLHRRAVELNRVTLAS